MASNECIYSDSDTPSRYVAGDLPAREAEAFEEHYFACARCWDEVRAGTAARTALGGGVQRAPRSSRRGVWWMSAAAAAIVALVTIVTIRERILPGPPDIVRGGSQQSIAPTVRRTAARMEISWRAVSGATRYDVTARNAEGEVLRRQSSVVTNVALDGTLEGDVFIRVAALNAEGEEIARSPLVRAPSPGR